MPRIPLVGGDYTLSSLAAAAQQCLNVFPESIEAPEGKNKAWLRNCPGRHLLAAAAGNGGGVWSGGGRLFVYHNAGTQTEFAEAGTVVSTHNFTTIVGDDRVQVVGNGNALMIVAGGKVWVDTGAALPSNGNGPVPARFTIAGTVDTNGTAVAWVSGDTFPTAIDDIAIVINDVAYVVASRTNSTNLVLTGSAGVQTGVEYYSSAGDQVTALSGTFLGGYGIVQRPYGGSPDLGRQFNISGLNDFTSWDELDFDVKSGWPDYIKSVYSEDGTLFLLGTEKSERWQHTGNADFPFEPIQNATIHMGSVSIWSTASVGGVTFILGSNSIGGISAYRIQGSMLVRVSTHNEETYWKAQTDFAEHVSCYCYEEDGHEFYVVNRGIYAQVFDITTGLWHQRSNWDNPAFSRYGPEFHTFIPEWGDGGIHIVTCGSLTGVFKSSTAYYDQDTANSKWIRALPYQYAGGKQMFFSRLTLEMETGGVASASTGVVETSATQVDWISGNVFPLDGSWNGVAITINGVGYTVSSVTNSTRLILTGTAGIQSGVAYSVAAGAEGTLQLDWSEDRGNTFSTPVSAGTGIANAYARRVFWNRLGSGRQRIFRLTGTSRSKVALIDLDLEMSEGAT